MVESFILIPVAFLGAVVFGNLLFARYSKGSQAGSALFGIVSNTARILVGVLIMMGGTWFHIAVGMTVITLSWYFGRGHKSRLDKNTGSVRSKLNG